MSTSTATTPSTSPSTTSTTTLSINQTPVTDNTTVVQPFPLGIIMFIVILIWIWVISGLLAFIVSLVCFGFNGSIADKFLGLLIVLAVGPFYWLYFIYNNNYCTR